MFKHDFTGDDPTICKVCGCDNWIQPLICTGDQEYINKFTESQIIYNVVESYFDYENTFETVVITLEDKRVADMIAMELKILHGRDNKSYYVDDVRVFKSK